MRILGTSGLMAWPDLFTSSTGSPMNGMKKLQCVCVCQALECYTRLQDKEAFSVLRREAFEGIIFFFLMVGLFMEGLFN